MPTKYVITDKNGDVLFQDMHFETMDEALEALSLIEIQSDEEYLIQKVESSGAV